ncbi:MAG: hypothetical protein ABJR05_11130 [Balneola sp.]
MKEPFIHVLRGDLTLGLAYLDYPKCIMWLQPEEFGHCFQWIDTDISIKDHNKVKLLLEMKEIELRQTSAEGFPLVCFERLLIDH